jgi:MFS family permease
MTATAGFNGLLFAMPAFLPRVMGYTNLIAIQAQNVCLVVLSCGLLVAAWLGDRIPRRRILGTGAFLIALLSFPFFQAAADHSVGIILLFAAAGLVASLINGPMSAIAADLFPTRIRFTGVALSFNLAFSVFSGAAPLAATLLVKLTGSPVGPAYFMCGCALVALVGSLFIGRYDGRILSEHAAAAAPQS